MRQKKYKDYKAYLADQKAGPNSRPKQEWIKRYRKRELEQFKKWYSVVDPYMDLSGAKSLCLGPQVCSEIIVLRELGSDCIGLDLVPQEDYVVEGDFHDPPFPDGAFDFVYSNALDHVWDLGAFVAGAERVLRSGGLALFHLSLGQGIHSFDCMGIDHQQEVLDLMGGFEILLSEKPDPGRRSMNWIILARKASPGEGEN